MNAESLENPQTPADAGAAPSSDAATPGGLLRGERSRRSMSVQQAAEELHLDVWMVEALESNRFLALGAPVYAKGHLRKYAMLLGLDPEALIERYRAMNDTPAVPTPQPTTSALPTREHSRSWIVRALLGVAGLLLAALAAWVVVRLNSGPASQAPPPASGVEREEVVTPAASSPTLPSPTLQSPSGEVVSDTSAAVPSPAEALPPPAEATPPPLVSPAASPAEPTGPQAGAVSLTLHFSESSWVEAFDGSGQRLMYDMGVAGRSRVLSGTPPLSVVVGVASAVTAEVNGVPIVVPRRAGREATRFAVDANGVMR